ncbi:MAG: YfcE family phosphodiesterase [Desulfobacter sp.]|nr:YfcE family phosphodiesterase [Desulfobacter sp.]WDP85981.1 MAG: YfcE family phosphodiesterase [Desulfobacter sp.]
MAKILVTADIHGSMAAWLTVQALMSEQDSLVVAGDLFDTRYGNYGSQDFQPDHIRSDLKSFDHPFYYVYGNCDVESYYPGQSHEKQFLVFGKTILLHHGHKTGIDHTRADIIIQGHTHLCSLEKKQNKIFLNPGSIALPRNNLATYASIDEKGISLLALKTGKPLASISFS